MATVSKEDILHDVDNIITGYQTSLQKSLLRLEDIENPVKRKQFAIRQLDRANELTTIFGNIIIRKILYGLDKVIEDLLENGAAFDDIIDAIIGEIRAFLGDPDDDRWLETDGSALPKDQWPELYGAIGDQYSKDFIGSFVMGNPWNFMVPDEAEDVDFVRWDDVDAAFVDFGAGMTTERTQDLIWLQQQGLVTVPASYALSLSNNFLLGNYKINDVPHLVSLELSETTGHLVSIKDTTQLTGFQFASDILLLNKVAFVLYVSKVTPESPYMFRVAKIDAWDGNFNVLSDDELIAVTDTPFRTSIVDGVIPDEPGGDMSGLFYKGKWYTGTGHGVGNLNNGFVLKIDELGNVTYDSVIDLQDPVIDSELGHVESGSLFQFMHLYDDHLYVFYGKNTEGEYSNIVITFDIDEEGGLSNRRINTFDLGNRVILNYALSSYNAVLAYYLDTDGGSVVNSGVIKINLKDGNVTDYDVIHTKGNTDPFTVIFKAMLQTGVRFKDRLLLNLPMGVLNISTKEELVDRSKFAYNVLSDEDFVIPYILPDVEGKYYIRGK